MLKKMCDANAIHGRISEYAIQYNIHSALANECKRRKSVTLDSMQTVWREMEWK